MPTRSGRLFFLVACALSAGAVRAADGGCDIPRIAFECDDAKAQLAERARKPPPPRADETAAAQLAKRCGDSARTKGIPQRATTRKLYGDLLVALGPEDPRALIPASPRRAARCSVLG